ncbi:RimJ/RimL family protein N-acetyltransferase [Amycolatopsis cihanbeyliensis]|uniref:RimJ/RimL family protein N-acetyltransferase n=1 Tax=Amycolatopsis cihanbeyliensis TaxID=1128664 RepID=A0A542DEP4_AMYCI|nr:RimJ/RimL family protein N-acetyltransferase [Amycolatopsis cihanbeyliensis]
MDRRAALIDRCSVTERLEADGGLILRPWDADDVDAVLAAFTDEDLWRQSVESVDTPDAAAAWLTARARHWEAGSGYAWAITSRAGVVLGNAEVTSVDHRHGTGWVSYWTTRPARGRGVATAGCRAVSEWALRELGLFRLELGHRVNNPASCRVALRAGYRPEGVQRKKLRYGEARYDVEMHARLATDRRRLSS